MEADEFIVKVYAGFHMLVSFFELVVNSESLLMAGDETAAMELVMRRPGGLPSKNATEAAKHARELIKIHKSLLEQRLRDEEVRTLRLEG